ncbi:MULTISPECIES: PepSY domain-containing protein [unclassified Thalassolituus]|uniref:PepSY domain-containing protein n=1 Tax=unclassified Thalassolituus TaxID=2624967 RepID=UPI000C4FA586|nr:MULTISPECIES: PepSY domain-containing protein [unclassified Thalassolituus]MAS24216.1 hypothetical protein [Oceanospirillaceae bacterium]MBL33772.1 hypothetical protein [Oceanospirillaceae bacterium]|tara:strand:- start:1757 stop:2560 length:804 start_codon:yes stop_codon:yes gene_type:complete
MSPLISAFSRLAGWIKWHRRAGLLVAPVLVMVAVTGLLINHSEDFDWHSEPVYSPFIGWLYGIPPQRIQQGVRVNNDWLVQVGDDIYLTSEARRTGLQESALLQCRKTAFSAALWQMGFFVLCDHGLNLYLSDGQLVEKITELPPQAMVAGQLTGENGGSSVALRSETSAWYLDENSWQWQPLNVDDASERVQWSESVVLPDILLNQVNAAMPLPGLSLERVLLDLHSGRLFGQWGIWVVDASAVLMLFLAFSGTLTWAIRQRRKRR